MFDAKLAPYATAVLRVTLGVLAFAHGYLKYVVLTPAGTVNFFASLGLSAIFAYAVISLEIVGGLALIVGYKSRYVSIAMIPMLIGSIVFAHSSAGWLFSNEGCGWEFPAFWAVALVVQAMLGDGAFALYLGTKPED